MDEEPFEISKWANLYILCVPALQQSFCLKSFLSNPSFLPATDLLKGIRIVSKILIPLKIFPLI